MDLDGDGTLKPEELYAIMLKRQNLAETGQ